MRSSKTKHPQVATSPADWISRNPVFRLEEFVEAHRSRKRSPATIKALLRYHVATGRLVNLRKGLYAVDGRFDPWLIGSRVTSDAVLAYDGALSFYGFAPEDYQLCFLTAQRVRRFSFDEIIYTPVNPPARMRQTWRLTGVNQVTHLGQQLRVTSLERTLVDMLDRLDLVRGIEELGRDAFALADCFIDQPLDPVAMVNYGSNLKSRSLAARLGFFLEFRSYVRPGQLKHLDALRPNSPVYFDRSTREPPQIFLERWNLLVPENLWLKLNRGAAAGYSR